LDGVVNAVDFSKRANNGSAMKINGPVIVQGGSRPSLLVARTAIRLGAGSVKVVHPSPLELWPAGADAIRHAEKEGVEILAEHRIKEAAGSGKVESVIVRPVRIRETDGVGRPTGDIETKEQRIDAVLLVTTPERRAHKEDQPNVGDFKIGVLGNLVVDKDFKTNRNGWYAAGEAATGAATVVDSMATGRLAAEAIGRDLVEKREVS
jgi:NADPH-dependent glutamate synthase beta subunit-like oxidoreductase